MAEGHLTVREMAPEPEEAPDEDVVHYDVLLNDYRAPDFSGGDGQAKISRPKREFEQELSGRPDVDFSRRLGPELQSFEEWLDRNVFRIPVE